MPIFVPEEIKKRYEQSLASLTAKLQQERMVVAAILFGSLSYDEVWENSDIDIWVIVEDDQKSGSLTLTEYDINIHAQIITRSDFKRRMEGDLTGGWLDFTFAKSTLLFTRDDSIKTWYSTVDRVGTRDKTYQLMRAAAGAMPALNKAEKYFHLKEDYAYSFWWLMQVVRSLAIIEVVSQNVAPGREVIHQALKFNSEFFDAVYTQLMNQSKTRKNVQHALDRINQYLQERAQDLFRPLLDYLTESGEVRALSEINDYFHKKIHGGGLEEACEWLVKL
ncbi:MAG: nucleotidyltransferase domain-containing protein, partial [bacterium]|nr:nucleotidyltransferase domain-containing protein [bacterium]